MRVRRQRHVPAPAATGGAIGRRCRCTSRARALALPWIRVAEAAAQFRAASIDCDPGDDTDLRSNLGVAAAMILGDADAVLTEHTKLLAYAREHGALVLIVYALTRRGFGEIATGDWTTLTADAAEALERSPPAPPRPSTWPAPVVSRH